MPAIPLLLTPEFQTCAPKQWLPIFLFSERKVCHSSVMVTMADKLSDKEVSGLRLALSTQDALPGSEYTHCMYQWSYMVKYISSLTASACRPLTFTVDRVVIRLGGIDCLVRIADPPWKNIKTLFTSLLISIKGKKKSVIFQDGWHEVTQRYLSWNL